MFMTRRLALTVLALLAAAFLAACGEREEYAVELGFYQDGRLRWDISGNYPSFELCREAALARHEIYTRQDREFSWACLKRDGAGGYSNRYR